MGRHFGRYSYQSRSGGSRPIVSTDVGFGSTVALKEDQIQLVTNSYGDIPSGSSEGYGLYMLDTRYLSVFEMLVDGQVPIYLSHSADRNYIATFQFVNPPLLLSDGTRVPRQTISIRRSRFVDTHGLHERIGLYNCNQFLVDLDVTLTFDVDFADIFAVREYAHQRRGIRSSVQFSSKRLTFSYVGRDKLHRKTLIEYDRQPEPKTSNSMVFSLQLGPHVPVSITLAILPVIGNGSAQQKSKSLNRASRKDGFDANLNVLAQSYESWHRDSTAFQTNNELFDRSLLRQSRLDIRALLEFSDGADSGGDGRLIVPSAGIPWYAVPFGRDAIITALQTLIYNPRIAEGTLRVLARYQGVRENEATEEEPGKIFHELRRGELANLGEIPHLPYYGTIDATPLFVVLFVETMAWLNDSPTGQALYRDLLPAALRALEWCDTYGDFDGDGYLEHRPGREGGVTNQGWKDSFDSLQYPDGSLAELPAALIEVQGYVYEAKIGLGRLAVMHDDDSLGVRLEHEAEALKARFNRDFWMPDEGFFAQALDAGKRPVPSITSNAGHALWSGLAERDKAGQVVDRLMTEDMFSGWGIRTLSAHSPNYNPMSYHNGSVWPHDNSIIALGMQRYGFDKAAAEVIEAVTGAGLRFPGNRLPELFCGFPRDRKFNSNPAAYIVSCSPQAWAAASPFLFLQTLLGIRPLPGRGLRIEPVSNDLFVRQRIEHLRVGDDRVSFEVHNREGECRLRKLDGDVELFSDSARLE
jgi:glycogen debranching enzyme